MKLSMDPMARLRADAVEKIDSRFAEREIAALYKEGVYTRKRTVAQAIANGERLPNNHPFVAEAALRGLPQEQFAQEILAKPDVAGAADARELLRQNALIKIKAATSPAEIATVLAAL